VEVCSASVDIRPSAAGELGREVEEDTGEVQERAEDSWALFVDNVACGGAPGAGTGGTGGTLERTEENEGALYS